MDIASIVFYANYLVGLKLPEQANTGLTYP